MCDVVLLCVEYYKVVLLMGLVILSIESWVRVSWDVYKFLELKYCVNFKVCIF